MKKLLKWLAIILGCLVGLIILLVAAVYAFSSFRINKSYNIQVESVEIPEDPESIEWGKHIATTRGCADCHHENFAGGAFIEDPAIGNIYASNLTSGQGGVGSFYTDRDWVRALRHGIGPDSKPLLFMPSQEFYFLNNNDLGALVAYLKTLPPVDNLPLEDSIGPLGRALFLAGEFPLVPAEEIDHDGPRPDAPPPGITAAYGEYLAVGCSGCHGKDFSGGPIPGAPPEWPPARNLTPAGNPGTWSEADFIETMRTGQTPEGDNLNATYMPWPNFGQMTDDELKAIWLFLNRLPSKEMASR